MSIIIARAALRPTTPAIAGNALSQTSAQIALLMPSVEPVSGIGGYFLSRRLSGSFAVIAFLQEGDFPYIDSGLSAGTTYDYQVQAVDQSAQRDLSLPSNIVTLTTTAATGNLRQNYGFYGCFDYSGGVNATRFTNGDQSIIANTQTTLVRGQPPDNLMGFIPIFTWRSVDTGTSGPSYNWSVVDSYVTAIRAKNKQYFLWVNPTAFAASGASITTGTKCVPDWLINELGLSACMGNYSLGGAAAVGAGVYIKWYTQGVYDAFVAFLQALITRYGSDPNCEGVILCIGTANKIANVVDTLGTKAPQINYDLGYNDTGMIAGYTHLMGAFRALTTGLNFWPTCDYLFNMAGSSSYTGQDVQWTAFINAAIQAQCVLGGIDSWTQTWIYPQKPYTVSQNAYGTITNVDSNGTRLYRRGIYFDENARGWRGPTPGVGTGFKGQFIRGCCQELTEMGGYIGQFGAADIWSTRGPNLDNANYMVFDVNYAQSGNYGLNKSPNTLWLASSSYESTYGPSVYTWIQSAGPTNTVNPYA